MKVYALVRELVQSSQADSVQSVINELKGSGFRMPSRQTVQRWISGTTSPLSGIRIFFPEPSEELSFFVGGWLGDGWGDENDGGKRMLLKVRSLDFATEFARAAEKVLHKTDTYWVRRTVDSGGAWYLVKVTSFMLYEFVNQPLSDLWRFIEPHPRGFLRGMFTAEGNPSVSVSQRRGPRLNVGVAVSNSDRELLVFARDLLLVMDFHPGKIRINYPAGKETNLGVSRRDNWLLSISRFSEVQRFAEVVGFADCAKQSKCVEAIALIKKTGNVTAASEWMSSWRKSRGDWVRREKEVSISSWL